MADVYIISDLHIGHNNIHEKWRTEFASQEDHDEAMVEAWNSVVKKNDVVKVLGDFIIGNDALKYLDHLNGTVHWILGNHDPKISYDVLKNHRKIGYVGGIMGYKGAVLSHAPIHPDELVYRNWSLNIHGHIHDINNSPRVRDDPRYFNVNADVIGYIPVRWGTIIKTAKRRLYGI